MSQLSKVTSHFLSLDAALALAFQSLAAPVRHQTTLPLVKANGHSLAENITAIRSVPFYDNSAVDGYGISFSDYEGGCRNYKIAYTLLAGEKPRALQASEAVCIMTGAALPCDVDTVIMKEDCKLGNHIKNAGFPPTTVLLPNNGVQRYMNTRFTGEDVREGHRLLDSNMLLSPPDIGLLASQGFSDVNVVAPLRIGLASTGGEVINYSSDSNEVSVIDCNRPMLSSALISLGYEVVDFGIFPDDSETLKQLFTTCSCDVLISSGGMSLGESDLMMSVITSIGKKIFHGVGIKPGRPVGLGLVDSTIIFGLPGNPVATYTCFLFLVLPILRHLRSLKSVSRETLYPADFYYQKRKGFREFVRVITKSENQEATTLHLYGKNGAAMVSSLSQAHGFAILDENIEQITPGENLPFVSFESALQ